MTLNAHKQTEKCRPIFLCTGTILHNLSQRLDFYFQCLKHLISSYIKDNQDLINKLTNLGPLPPNVKLFTTDVVSQCTQTFLQNTTLPQSQHGSTISIIIKNTIRLPTECYHHGNSISYLQQYILNLMMSTTSKLAELIWEPLPPSCVLKCITTTTNVKNFCLNIIPLH